MMSLGIIVVVAVAVAVVVVVLFVVDLVVVMLVADVAIVVIVIELARFHKKLNRHNSVYQHQYQLEQIERILEQTCLLVQQNCWLS